ncbi:siphovirus ReqiPepy6 Gp37-like family protein [Sporosarcina sp. E16_8]|uniref:siphovirus ReqiPepy6 Gp37-like family protein n=1 Tax=Sporosarcina sp. E16_8 TaxID=2789295 RepID=UPI001A931FFC|nr:siphovirus ReqiPepy6 Gp37-like family protein [Sporosarcina sp. E16_8]MBO0586110.1 siphovirus ReqiPepy6 Gp37-like family protein [Sporosarcina sp. E16_8]
MKPIRIFTPDIDLLGEISNYESLFFVRSFHGIGDLELRINRYKKYTDTLQKGNIIVVDKDLHKAYVVKHREIELDQNGKATENWLIKALELKIVASDAIALPPSHTANDNKSASVETVMKHYVNGNLINPVDPSRKVAELILAPDLNRGPHISWQSRFKVVAEELSEMSLLTGVGWGVRVDYALRKSVLDVAVGRDLSVNQTVNSPVIFSPQFDNIKNMHYVDSDLNYKNVAYVAGQGEGVDRRVIVVGTATGLNRRELFVDARDIEEVDEDDNPIPEAIIIQRLTERGLQKLAELAQETFLEAQIMTPTKTVDIKKETHFMTQFQIAESVKVTEKFASSFIYEQGWDLGDIVTVQNKDWGVTINTRITEVKEIYEPETGFTLEATFGQSRPTLISKIKQELSGVKTEITR